MATKEITLPWPAPALHSNTRADRRDIARAKSKHRLWAKHAALEAPRIARMSDATLFIEYYPPSRRGDVQNVPSSLKAYIDGIADAMGCDDRRFRVDYPSEWAGTSKPGRVVFRVVPPVSQGEEQST